MKKFLFFAMAFSLAFGGLVKESEEENYLIGSEAHEQGLYSDECGEHKTADKYYKKAYNYYKKSCDIGNYMGCAGLAELYSFGHGIEQDNKKAAKYFKTACDNKLAPACYNLGQIYYLGEGVEQNKDLAMGYFCMSCKISKEIGCDHCQDLKTKGYTEIK